MATETFGGETYTVFHRGDKVRAVLSTLFIKAGEEYTVYKTVKTNREPYAYAYYVADAVGELFRVKNGHIVLELA
jgi:hypothetical protein